MTQKTIAMAGRKNIALVAHDNKKEELIEWAKSKCKLLAEHSLTPLGQQASSLRTGSG
jgi:methylglyoxal synthase